MEYNVITGSIASIIIVAGAIYVTALRQLYSTDILVMLWMLALTSITWGLISQPINDAMYDISLIVIVVYLLRTQPCQIYKLHDFNQKHRQSGHTA